MPSVVLFANAHQYNLSVIAKVGKNESVDSDFLSRSVDSIVEAILGKSAMLNLLIPSALKNQLKNS